MVDKRIQMRTQKYQVNAMSRKENIEEIENLLKMRQQELSEI
jgi:hypothetical protein